MVDRIWADVSFAARRFGRQPGFAAVSIVTIGLGMAIGLAGALGGGRAIRSLLFEVSPLDPLTFTAAVTVTLAVVSAAAYLPARRATRVDPCSALRCE